MSAGFVLPARLKPAEVLEPGEDRMDSARWQAGLIADLQAVLLLRGIGEERSQRELGGQRHPRPCLLRHALTLPSPLVEYKHLLSRQTRKAAMVSTSG